MNLTPSEIAAAKRQLAALTAPPPPPADYKAPTVSPRPLTRFMARQRTTSPVCRDSRPPTPFELIQCAENGTLYLD